jgi:transcriptional regulator with XRE-family HTH domain
MAMVNIDSAGRFGTAFHAALEKQGMSLVEFARQIDGSYEYYRKVLRAQMFPNKLLLPKICKMLKMNVSEAEIMIDQDKLERRLGKKAFNAATGRSPHASEFDALIPHLTEQQIMQIIVQMKAMIRQQNKN